MSTFAIVIATALLFLLVVTVIGVLAYAAKETGAKVEPYYPEYKSIFDQSDLSNHGLSIGDIGYEDR